MVPVKILSIANTFLHLDDDDEFRLNDSATHILHLALESVQKTLMPLPEKLKCKLLTPEKHKRKLLRPSETWAETDRGNTI